MTVSIHCYLFVFVTFSLTTHISPYGPGTLIHDLYSFADSFFPMTHYTPCFMSITFILIDLDDQLTLQRTLLVSNYHATPLFSFVSLSHVPSGLP